MKVKAAEILLIIVILFLVCSSSLFWIGMVDKTKGRSIEQARREKWEVDSKAWQIQVTENVNALRTSQQQVLDVINSNIQTGRLIVPKQEKK